MSQKTSASNPTGNAAGGGDAKPDAPKKKKRSTNRANRPMTGVRVKLPTLDAFQKEVIFKLEGPGRVVVRLERLMGSDRVRLTDNKFMGTLLERLEEEEHDAWLKRTKLRKKNEKNRSRHLAIEGLMDPGEDMQDLTTHPVFRVNRVLKRLTLFDAQMSQGAEINPPPILAIEPFEYDDTGAVFKTYPGHTSFKKPSQDVQKVEKKPEEKAPEAITKVAAKQDEWDGEGAGQAGDDEEGTALELTYDYPEEWEGEGVPPYLALTNVKKVKAGHKSLKAIQESYGIAEDEDLMAAWEPYRSQLVELMFSGQTEKMLILYKTAKEVLGVYDRESQNADNFVKKIQRYLGMHDSPSHTTS